MIEILEVVGESVLSDFAGAVVKSFLAHLAALWIHENVVTAPRRRRRAAAQISRAEKT